MQFCQPGYAYTGPPTTTPYILNGYPEILGEGNLASVVSPNGSVQLVFIPTSQWSRAPYQTPQNTNNSNWNPTVAWIIRSVLSPVQPTFYQQPQTGFQPVQNNSHYQFSPVPRLSPSGPFELKFHNDISTSTSDILYFYPNLNGSYETMCLANLRKSPSIRLVAPPPRDYVNGAPSPRSYNLEPMDTAKTMSGSPTSTSSFDMSDAADCDCHKKNKKKRKNVNKCECKAEFNKRKPNDITCECKAEMNKRKPNDITCECKADMNKSTCECCGEMNKRKTNRITCDCKGEMNRRKTNDITRERKADMNESTCECRGEMNKRKTDGLTCDCKGEMNKRKTNDITRERKPDMNESTCECCGEMNKRKSNETTCECKAALSKIKNKNNTSCTCKEEADKRVATFTDQASDCVDAKGRKTQTSHDNASNTRTSNIILLKKATTGSSVSTVGRCSSVLSCCDNCCTE